MSRIKSTALLIEAGVCFGPLIPLLLFAVLSPPPIVMSAWWSLSAFLAVVVVLGGCAGLYGLFRLLRKIIDPAAATPPPLLLWVCLIWGLGALIPMTMFVLELKPHSQLFTLAPFFATTHFVYLGRRLLFSDAANKRMEPTR